MIIVAPPQHGKTEVVSRRYPAWALGKNPDFCFIGGSYNQDWANDNCRSVQQIMESDEYRAIFDVFIPDRSRGRRTNAKRVEDYFELEAIHKCSECGWMRRIEGKEKIFSCPDCQMPTVKLHTYNGRYKAVGRGGGATGRPAHILLVDDPFKDHAEAMSDTIREGCWMWYTGALRTRMQKGGGILIMATRWHDDDLIGRAIEQAKSSTEEFKDDWVVYRFAAQAGEGMDEGYKNQAAAMEWRKPGEPLSPGRFDTKDLKAIFSVLSSVQKAALYDGSPHQLKGNILEADKWQYYSAMPDYRDFDLIVMSVDCNFKEATGADNVAIQVWALSLARRYMLDYLCEQLSYSRTKDEIRTMKAHWPMISYVLVEDKANGSAVLEELGKEFTGFMPIEPDGGKISRAWSASGDLASRCCYLPQPTSTVRRMDGTTYQANWVTAFITNCKKFPNVAHDDDVDSFTQVINWARKGLGYYGLADYLKQEADRIAAGGSTKPPEPEIASPVADAEPPVVPSEPQCPKCGSVALSSGKQFGVTVITCNQCSESWDA